MEPQVENNPPQLNKPLFSPILIVVMSILFSFIPGMLLHALNWKRLGNKQRYKNSLLAFIIWSLIIILSVMVLPDRETVISLLALVLSIAYAKYFYSSQIKEFKNHLSAGGKKRSIWAGLGLCVAWIGCFAIIAFTIGFVGAYYVETQVKKVNDLLEKGEYAQAEVILKKLETSPDYKNEPSITFNLAVVFNETNRKKMALDLLEEYIKKYPDDANAKKFLSEIKNDLNGIKK